MRPQITGTVGKLGVGVVQLQPVLPGLCSDSSDGDFGNDQLPKE